MIFEKFDPRKVFWFAVALMVIGVILPLLMVLHVLDTVLYWNSYVYFLINVFAFICQIGGFLLGIASAAFYIKIRKSK